MFNPKVYSRCNTVQRYQNTVFLKKYERVANWKDSKCESVIDIGSGDGSFTSNILIRFLPESCKKVIGTDKFEDMVQHANENYKTDRISFEIFDAGDTVPEKYRSSFNHVFSFYTINIISDQVKAFSNIYDLLTPGGSCFLTIIGKSKLFETYKTLRKTPKWKNWLSNTKKLVSPYADCLEPKNTVTNIVTEVGFSNIHVEVEEASYEFEKINGFKEFMRGLNVTTIPEDVYGDFLNDFVDVAQKNGFLDKHLRTKFEVIVVCATKA